jgi:endonuclease I
MRVLTFVVLLFVGLFLSLGSFAQIPSDYYLAADGLSGESLKSALHDVIKDHVEFPYTSSNTDTWDILKESDRDTVYSDNVILFYSGWSVNGGLEYNDAKGWSREHVWAKSHGDFGTSLGAGTDCHHLRPCDISVNSARGNDDFDIGGSIYVDGDGVTQCKTDADSWEPRDEVKGDVARMLFYMAVRYEGENGEPDLELLDEVNTVDIVEAGKGFHGKLSTLIEWHKADPVDSFEINRNDVIYSFQNNRNPFIDHPEFVDLLWTVTSSKSVGESLIRVFPNPAVDYVVIELPDNIPSSGCLLSCDGDTVLNFVLNGSCRLSTSELGCGLYILNVVSGDRVLTSKLLISK